MEVVNQLKAQGLLAGVVLAEGVSVLPSPASLRALIDRLVEARMAAEFPPAALKDGVRNLLRRGGFKPSGRNKPASEYLVQAAREGRFPFINNLVDINNYLSLRSGLPISLLDASVLSGSICIRCGQPGEQYVFNESGQSINLAGLICVCGGAPEAGVPLGNPIKDSMAGKLKPLTESAAGIIYAPSDVVSEAEMEGFLGEFSALLGEYGGAQNLVQYIA